MPGLTLSNLTPPFPAGVPVHPLLIVDYELLLRRDEREINKLWLAATGLGFWYLKNHGTQQEVDRMFEWGSETFSLPLEEKLKYDIGMDGNSVGYKAKGSIATDALGTLDTVEFFTISQNDVFAYPQTIRRKYPEPVNRRMRNTLLPFAQKSKGINETFLRIFEERLGLPYGEFAKTHQEDKLCCSELRCVKTPPNQSSTGIGPHSDFGTLTIVHNRLGGLQVMPPGTDEWLYIKPLPGHAVCNIADALSLFSGGILRSSVHRVMPPPGSQSRYERYSICYFTRPNDDAILRALSDKSPLIAEAVRRAPPGQFEPGCTSSEWISRRIRNLCLKSRQVRLQSHFSPCYQTLGTQI
ncbi:Clavaminate synthase-like protein [Abortiporus biennis]|nr:Clavaminate synthase-like protein [Abortiporus biennis]